MRLCVLRRRRRKAEFTSQKGAHHHHHHRLQTDHQYLKRIFETSKYTYVAVGCCTVRYSAVRFCNIDGRT